MTLPLIEPSRCTEKFREDTLGHPDYVAEEKLDGARFMLYVDEEGITYFYSRRDFPRINRAANVPHIAKKYPGFEGTILDGEAIREGAEKLGDTSSILLSTPSTAIQKQKTNGYIKFHVFDVLFYKGQDCRRHPFHQRRKMLKAILKGLKNPHITAVEQRQATMEYFDEVVARGGEGLVLKNIHNGYGIGWAKMKKRSDVSCVITGFKPGKGKYEGQIGAIAVSVHPEIPPNVLTIAADENGVFGKVNPSDVYLEIGFASGMTDAVRQDISENQSSYIGRVVDVYAQELTKDNRLRHPVFHRFRDDVDPATCTLQKVKDDLKKGRK